MQFLLMRAKVQPRRAQQSRSKALQRVCAPRSGRISSLKIFSLRAFIPRPPADSIGHVGNGIALDAARSSPDAFARRIRTPKILATASNIDASLAHRRAFRLGSFASSQTAQTPRGNPSQFLFGLQSYLPPSLLRIQIPHCKIAFRNSIDQQFRTRLLAFANLREERPEKANA